jgi:ribosome recycling factor
MAHFFGETLGEVTAEAKSRMRKAVEDLGRELASIRTGRASLAILDPIRVDYYGTQTPLSQVATLGIPEPSMILVQPWDASQIGVIEKAILASSLGLNPANDGKVIRLKIPALTEERRKELVKHLHNVVENHRVAVRNIRRDANDTVKKLLKDKKVSEDEQHHNHDEVQALTDKTIKELDEASEAKEKEILEIG